MVPSSVPGSGAVRPPGVPHPAPTHVGRIGAERTDVDMRALLWGRHIDAPAVEQTVTRVAVEVEVVPSQQRDTRYVEKSSDRAYVCTRLDSGLASMERNPDAHKLCRIESAGDLSKQKH